jgi:predicted GIY-YIG superfamily endonuclease
MARRKRHFPVSAGRAGIANPVIAGLVPAIHLLAVMTGFWVYILASGPNGTLYVGVTRDLVRRVFEHREGLAPGFTKRYNVKRLVYFERHDTALCGDPAREEHQALVA